MEEKGTKKKQELHLHPIRRAKYEKLMGLTHRRPLSSSLLWPAFCPHAYIHRSTAIYGSLSSHLSALGEGMEVEWRMVTTLGENSKQEREVTGVPSGATAVWSSGEARAD